MNISTKKDNPWKQLRKLLDEIFEIHHRCMDDTLKRIEELEENKEHVVSFYE